jgi:hypothetical protein
MGFMQCSVKGKASPINTCPKFNRPNETLKAPSRFLEGIRAKIDKLIQPRPGKEKKGKGMELRVELYVVCSILDIVLFSEKREIMRAQDGMLVWLVNTLGPQNTCYQTANWSSVPLSRP